MKITAPKLVSRLFTGILIVIITPFALHGKKHVDVDWGSFSRKEKNKTYHKIIGYDDNGFYVLSSKEKNGTDIENISYFLEYFSSTTKNKKYSNEIILPMIKGSQTQFESIYHLGGKFILFSSIVDNESLKGKLYGCHIDNKGEMIGKPYVGGTFKCLTIKRKLFNIQVSENKKNLIICFLPVSQPYNSEYYILKTIDRDFKELRIYKLVLPLLNREIELKQFDIDDKGYVIFSLKVKRNEKRRRRRKKRYDNIILVYNPHFNRFKQYVIKQRRYLTTNIIFRRNPDDNLIVAGFIKQRHARHEGFTGIFYKKLNYRAEKFVKLKPKTNYIDFSRDRNFFSEFTRKHNGKTEQQCFNYEMDSILFLDDGSFFLIAENRYVRNVLVKSTGSKETEVIHYYHNNDLLLAYVDDDGIMKWKKRIPKNQFSSDDHGIYSSYALYLTKYNTLKIVYNDHPANIRYSTDNADKYKRLKNWSVMKPKGMAVVATVFTVGDVTKERLFKKENDDIVISPKLYVAMNNGCLIYGQEKKEYVFGTFFFE